MSQPAETDSSYQVVARRYRPGTFDALIGQDQVAKVLSGAIQADRVGHAYLFTGARGVGKTSTARIFAKALNCVHGPTTSPCNECEICKAISTGDDIDVLEIDGASNRGVEEIRQIRSGATVRPSRARYKIYIIDEVHMLTKEAFNALLKTLEEPPIHVKFIFCTTEPNKIPITILSRCQRFDFAGIGAEKIASHLENVAKKEGITLADGVGETLARRASGSMRDALSLLEQLLSFGSTEITLADVHSLLGTVDDRNIGELLTAIQEEAPEKIFPILTRAANEGVDFGVLMEQLFGSFRDLLALSAGCSAKELLYASPARFEELKKLAVQFGPDRLLASMQILDQTISRMRYSTQGRILAELAILRLARLGQLEMVAALIEKLKNGSISVPVLGQGTARPEKKTANSTVAVPNSPKEPYRGAASARKIPGSAVSSAERDVPPASAAVPAGGPVSSDEYGDSAGYADAGYSDANYAGDGYAGNNYVGADSAVPAEPPEEPSVDFAAFSPDELKRYWIDLTHPLGVFLSSQAAMARSTRFEAGKLTVFFSADAQTAAHYCDEQRTKILDALRAAAGPSIQLAVEIMEGKPSGPAESSGTTSGSVPRPADTARSAAPHSGPSRIERMRQAMNHPMVRAASALFHAELVEVCEPNKK